MYIHMALSLYKTEKPGGPIPKFSDYHVWKCLKIIGTSGPVGRKSLSIDLAIGEGSTRTILDRLVEEKLVEINRSGAVLARRGKDILKNSLIEVREIEDIGITIDVCNTAVRIPNMAHRISFGCEQRDTAIKAGARGATTLFCHEGKIYFPGDKEPVDIEIDQCLRKHFRVKDGDVMIIGTAGDYERSEEGAVTAALELTGEMRSRNTLSDVLSSSGESKELISLAIAIHELLGRLPLCARSRDKLGVRIEDGKVIDQAYTGPILEEVLRQGVMIRMKAPSGPYSGIPIIAVPVEVDERVIAVIGVVDITKGAIFEIIERMRKGLK